MRNWNLALIIPIGKCDKLSHLELHHCGGVVAITNYPLFCGFENGGMNWTSGAISGADHWQLGTPTVAPMNTAHSGANVWATYLSQNYANNADTWLKSPAFNFNEISNPNFSVWLHLNCESGWDGMILESSIDNGSSWQKVIGDAGFYNNTSTNGPIAPDKWSGQIVSGLSIAQL